MTITDIAEKQAEERKREKRLVHLTNALGRDFVDSLKLKTKADKGSVEFFAKSFLDYIFFDQHKEIGEIHEEHIRHFLLEFAPQKLVLQKEIAKGSLEILSNLCNFLESKGYIKNSHQLNQAIKENSKQFLKLIEPSKKSIIKKEKPLKEKKATPASEIKAGRNDPCPCGSGKKYKKCCGKLK